MNRKVVAYIRVSTDEQAEHGHSIEVQQQVLADYATGHELEVVETFVESESAYKPGRPEFEKMVGLLKKQKTVTAVLCYKIDRVSRNMKDYAQLVEELGIEIISATEQLPSNAAGRFMGDMHAVFSRYFSAQLSERVGDAMYAMARKGIYPSYAPIGYVNDKETGRIVPDLERAPLIRELFETYASTDLSLDALVEWAKKRGLRSRRDNPLQTSTVYRILTNPIYKGVLRWSDVVAPGVHEPLVSLYLFERVADKLNRRGHIQGKHDFPFRGILVCGYCGCQITASLIKGKYVYYHCTKGRGRCAQRYIRQEALSERLRSVVDGVRIPEEVVARLLDQIHSGETQRREEIEAKLKRLDTESGDLKKRRDKAYIDKLDGVLSEERWKELEAEWASHNEAIDLRQEQLRATLQTSGADDAREAFELLEQASDLYLEQEPEERAKALKILVSNCRLTGEKLEPNYRKPFDLVAEGLRTGIWYPGQESNL